jgi:colanic acid/amylovoran biosynthesis glycosyltransferase
LTEATDRSAPEAERPVVACYCATFLKPEMLHIYRQITSLTRVSPVVIARKREEAGRYPFDRLTVIGRPSLHFARRFWFKQVRAAPWQISKGEVDTLIGVLEKAQAKLLHIFFGHIAVHLLPLIRTWGKPSVVSFHGADVMVDLDKPAYRTATKEMLAAVQLVLVRSESLGHALIELGCPPKKIRIQRTGIPVDEIPFRARLWPSDGAWKFVQACRLIEKKGLRTSLLAFTQFAKRYPQSTFVIAGEGPLRTELEAQARGLGLSEKISFSGFVSQAQLREIFYRSHIFLHPSELGADGNQEGVPNSILEAMASGLAVFATEHGGIPEAIDHGKSGILVKESDHEALTRALLDAAAHPDQLTTLARNGADSIRQKFAQKTQTRRLEDYYFEAMVTKNEPISGRNL